MSTPLRAVPVSQDRSDVDLVAAVRRGSDTAFEELYSRYSHRINAYVHGMVGDHGRSEDITQEIFIAALRRMRETERPIAFKAWIYEIAKNACIDNFRRARRAQEVSLDADDDLSSADRGRLAAVTTLDAAIDSKQALHDLRGAFGGLSESHHEILVLRELEGRSYSDIGERLGMSRPVVESTLFRARRRLAEEYDELTSGRRCEFVRKMVDSGPHYSLGIRDRRRMARHFAHCQPCRAHARLAGFDESILNMPGVAARIALLLPIPLLRARWGAFEGGVVRVDRGRSSVLALRSVHALARSSDQIVGAGAGAGRSAATAAALVLAGVGGGIATVTSSEPAKYFAPVIAHGAHARAPAHLLRAGQGSQRSVALEAVSTAYFGRVVSGSAASPSRLSADGSSSRLHRSALSQTGLGGSGVPGRAGLGGGQISMPTGAGGVVSIAGGGASNQSTAGTGVPVATATGGSATAGPATAADGSTTPADASASATAASADGSATAADGSTAATGDAATIGTGDPNAAGMTGADSPGASAAGDLTGDAGAAAASGQPGDPTTTHAGAGAADMSGATLGTPQEPPATAMPMGPLAAVVHIVTEKTPVAELAAPDPARAGSSPSAPDALPGTSGS